VQVPSDIADLVDYPDCFRFEAEQTAECADPLVPRATGSVRAATYAGQYPPLYYLLVGWPSLPLSGAPAVYAMRLVSAAITAALLTWGIVRLRELDRRRAAWGAALALTPMCLFIGSAVNPNGVEIACAFSFWTACLALARRRSDADVSVAPPTSWWVQAGLSGALLLNIRTSGPIWASIVVVVAVLAARPGAVRGLARSWQVWPTALLAVVAGALSVGWVLTHRDIVTTTSLFPEFAAPRLVAAVMLLATPALVDQMIGNFGWLDTSAPYPTILVWYATVSALLLVALVQRGQRRARIGILAVLAAVVLVPIALTIPTAEAAGIVWQGRYTLPLAVGLAPLSVLLLAPLRGEVASMLDRLATLSVCAVGVAHVGAFYWAARRYAEGSEGLWVTVDPRWGSPLGFLPAVALYGLLVAVATAVAVRSLRHERAAEPGQPAGRTVDLPNLPGATGDLDAARRPAPLPDAVELTG
jgi:hypothetical protein